MVEYGSFGAERGSVAARVEDGAVVFRIRVELIDFRMEAVGFLHHDVRAADDRFVVNVEWFVAEKSQLFAVEETHDESVLKFFGAADIEESEYASVDGAESVVRYFVEDDAAAEERHLSRLEDDRRYGLQGVS